VTARDVTTLYVQELRSALRERNIVVYSVLLPLLLYPLLLWAIFAGLTFVRGQQEGFVSRVALVGLPAGHEALRDELTRDKKVELVESPPPDRAADAVREGTVDAVADFEDVETGGTGVAPPNFRVRVVYDASKDRSAGAKARIDDAVERYRTAWVSREAARLGLAPSEFAAFAVTSVNVASARNVGAFLLKMLLPTLLVAMVALGCFYPAIDATAGERERSTWETTMTLAADRSSIVAAKYLYVATLGFAAGLLNIAAMVLTIGPILASLLGSDAAEKMSFAIPVAAVPVVALGAMLTALFIAAGMMICAAFARTFREGQSMVSPFYLLVILPALFLQTPDLEFTWRLALVPVINVAMMFRDAISGVFQWPLIATTVAVELALIAACLALARRILDAEDVLTGAFTGSVVTFLRGGRRARGARS
jgi:sodium transport system permease protein